VTEARAVPVDFDPFADGEVLLTAPMTPEQAEIWLSVRLGGAIASCAYNESVSLHFSGNLDTAALERACQKLVARHDALRSTVSPDGATLCIGAQTPVSLPITSGTQSSVRREAEARATSTPFDLEHGPLVRFELVRVAPDDHVLVFSAHHLVCDGWSLGVLVPELAAIYSHEAKGAPLELAEAPSFGKHARALRDGANAHLRKESETYWLARYAEGIPTAELPTDRPRPRERTFEATRVDRELDAAFVARIKATSKRCGISFVGFLLGAFEVWFAQLAGRDSVVVALPAAGQAAGESHDLVGHCVRTLPIRADVRRDASFREHLTSARRRLADATAHQELAFGELLTKLPIARDASRIPLASVMFNVDTGLPPVQFEGLAFDYRSNPRIAENFELSLNATERDGGLVLETTYNVALFDDETIRMRVGEYVTLLESVVDDPEQRIDSISLLSARERERIVGTLAAGPEREAPATFLELFARQVRERGERVAVESNHSALRYDELDLASNRLANHLRSLGVDAEVTVGIALDRGTDLVVALLATMKAGGAYVPLDRDHPRDRLSLIVDDAKLAVIITTSDIAPSLPPTRATLVELDRDSTEVASLSSVPPVGTIDRNRLCYVLHTSGSTGKPKGVEIEHGALASFLVSMAEEPGLGPDDTLVAVTTLSFDIAGLELYLPLSVGARVVVATTDEARDGAKIRALLESTRATMFQATPSTHRLLVDAGLAASPHLTILCGGEALPPDLARALVERAGRVWNVYGPTETTIWSTLERIDASNADRISVGRPIANTRVYVLDANRAPVPLGAHGELYIGGRNVARGYRDRAELTSDRFVADPFAGGGTRMYRTGDLVRMRRDGRLEWLSRLDHQVKVRGYRIELGEIEAVLGRHPSVREVVVLVREDRPGDQRIVAYVVGVDPDAAALRAHAAAALPAYMVPQHVAILPSMPHTPNGKIDRAALPKPDVVLDAGVFVAPRTEVERVIASIAAELLAVPKVAVDASFFDLGGHSMLAIRLTSRIRDALGVELPLRRVFATPTVAGMAEHVEAVRYVAASTRRAEATELEEIEL